MAASVVRGSVVAAAFRDRWDVLLVIATGGAMGSLARWSLGVLLPTGSHEFPWSTWAVNVVGAFLLGVLMVFVLDVAPPSRYLRPFVGVGVLGGFTTFSTYVLDTRTLLASGDGVAAGAYLLGTLLTGLVAVWAGVVLARAALSHPRGDEPRRTR